MEQRYSEGTLDLHLDLKARILAGIVCPIALVIGCRTADSPIAAEQSPIAQVRISDRFNGQDFTTDHVLSRIGFYAGKRFARDGNRMLIPDASGQGVIRLDDMTNRSTILFRCGEMDYDFDLGIEFEETRKSLEITRCIWVRHGMPPPDEAWGSIGVANLSWQFGEPDYIFTLPLLYEGPAHEGDRIMVEVRIERSAFEETGTRRRPVSSVCVKQLRE